MRLLAAVIILLPVVAQAQVDQSREALLTALAMNECAVTEDETPRVFGAQGFDGEFVRRELGQMVLDGAAFLEGGHVLRVRADHCPPPEPVPTPAQIFRASIQENGCRIDEGDAHSLGTDPERMRPVVMSWIESGAARIEDDTLTLEGCE